MFGDPIVDELSSAGDVRSEDEAGWIRLIEDELAHEQPFRAYDICGKARQRYPHSIDIALLGVLALMRGRSFGAARQAFIECRPDIPDAPSPRSRGLLAEIHHLAWEQAGDRDDLRRSRGLYAGLFEEFQGALDGVRAAMMSWRLGERDEAYAIAETLLAQNAAAADGEDALARFRRLTHRGHAAVILARPQEALDAYGEATAGWDGGYQPVVAALKEVTMLAWVGLAVPEGVRELLRPPRVVIFGGPVMDSALTPEPILPPGKEAALRAAIAEQLDEVEARIGYSSAACGADLLFLEVMLERGAEINIILPCDRQDFLAARVAYAGPQWVARFERVLARAATVSHATEERYLGHADLLRYANAIITGMGWLRAELLLTEPHLLAVWDFRAENAPGSPADFIDHWPDITSLHLIQLDELAADEVEAPAPRMPADATPLEPRRVIRAMLFADVVGYSKLGEEYLPRWMVLQEKIKAMFAATGTTPELIESWGDALYVVTPSARSLLGIAFVLRDAFRRVDHVELGLPQQLNVRIGLHAGPVFVGIDPMTGNHFVRGRQVNRAARIEPITMPGEVYASQEFVALLTAEENAVRHEAGFSDEPYRLWYHADYLGVIAMPKKHGMQQIYHLIPAAERPHAIGEA